MRAGSTRRLFAAAALTFTLAAPSLAWAGDTSTAETLFSDGLAAMKRDDYRAACDAFAGSNEADPSPGTQINLALCNEKQGKVATAWGWYRTAAGLADQRGQRERAELARGEAAKLEPKLHKLVIKVKYPVDGLAVVRDGATVPSAVIGKEVPVDPGEHTIEVSAKGKKPRKQRVSIAGGPGVDYVDVPALEDAPEGGGAVVAPPGNAAGDKGTAATTGSDGSTQRTIGFVVGGVGIVALVLAGGIQIFNLAVTNQEYKDVERDYNAARCNDLGNRDAARCDGVNNNGLVAALKSKDDARDGNQAAAIGIGIGGAVLLAGGLVLLFTAPSSSPKTASTEIVVPKPRLLPVVSKDTMGFGLSGTF